MKLILTINMDNAAFEVARKLAFEKAKAVSMTTRTSVNGGEGTIETRVLEPEGVKLEGLEQRRHGWPLFDLSTTCTHSITFRRGGACHSVKRGRQRVICRTNFMNTLNQTKHTPGPWHLMEFGGCSIQDCGASADEACKDLNGYLNAVAGHLPAGELSAVLDKIKTSADAIDRAEGKEAA